jgi:hypothetical protein
MARPQAVRLHSVPRVMVHRKGIQRLQVKWCWTVAWVEGKEVMEVMEEEEEREPEGLEQWRAEGTWPENLWPVSKELLK